MPLFSWLCSSTPSAASSPTVVSATSATSAMTAYQAAMQQATTGTWTVYNDAQAVSRYFPLSTTSSTAPNMVWFGSNAATGTSTCWIDGNGDCYVVDHQQYVALAQARAAQHAQRLQEEAEQQAERTRRRLEREAIYRASQPTDDERRAALVRSRELLLSHLTPAQRETFEKNNWFVVQGGKTRTRYRIWTTGYTHNIETLRGHDDVVTYRLCGHLRDSRMPLYDHHVAQKISLEYDEEAFVRLCNRSAA